MKKRFIFFTLLLLTLVGGVKFNVLNAQEQQIVEIGEDQNPSAQWQYYLPVYEYKPYSITQQVYLEEDFDGNIGNITSVSFKLGNTRSEMTRNWEVYLQPIDASSTTTTFTSLTDAVKVFDGNVKLSGIKDDWVTVNFTTQFPYSEGNVLLSVYDKSGSALTQSYHTFYAFNTTNRSICKSSDTELDLNSNLTGSNRANTNQIRFTFVAGGDVTPVTPSTPKNLTATAINYCSIALKWDAAENAKRYKVYNGENIVKTVSGTSCTIDGLDGETTYTFTVTAVNGSEESGHSNVATATTPVTPAMRTIELVLTDSYGDGWNGNKMKVSYPGYNELFENQNLDGQYGSETQTITIEIPVDTEVTLTYEKGNGSTYPDENSFVIRYKDGDIIWQKNKGELSATISHTFIVEGKEPKVEVSAKNIALGTVRLGNYWTEKQPVSKTFNVVAKNTTVTGVTCDNTFFEVVYESGVVTVSYDNTVDVSGEQTGTITIDAEGASATVAVSATAYDPALGDVWEKPITVTFENNAFTHNAEGMHDDYILPDEAEDGNLNDAVYKFTLDKYAVVTANVNGSNAIAAIYKAEDLQGNGPSSDNNYTGGQSGPTAPTTFECGFEDASSMDNFTYDQNVWSYYNAYGFKGAKASDKLSRMATKNKYVITENSQFSLTYTLYNSEKVVVEISEDGSSFTVIGKFNTTYGATNTINLSEYNGMEVYFAVSIEDYGSAVFINNLQLTDGSAKSRGSEAQIDGVQYPAGDYYLVAAAKGDFTLNLSLPAPESFAYTAPENNTIVEETNPELSWGSAKYATSYDVYLGTTKVAEDITATSFQTTGLSNNTKYNWQVVAKNSIGEFKGAVYSFITPLDIPQNVTAAREIYPDNNNETNVTITWNAITGVKGYNVYVNDIKRNGEQLVTTNSYVSNMDYSLNGHVVYVTAVYDIDDVEYESDESETTTVKVTGYSDLLGKVTDTDEKGIAGATVVATGTDEFGHDINPISTTTDNDGNYEFTNVLAGNYSITASKDGYIVNTVSAEVIYNAQTNANIELLSPTDKIDNITATIISDDEALVSWNADFDKHNVKYNVYRKIAGTETAGEPIATVTNKEYTDTDWAELSTGSYQYGVNVILRETSTQAYYCGFESGLNGWTKTGSAGASNYWGYYYQGYGCYFGGTAGTHSITSSSSSFIDLNEYNDATLKFYLKNNYGQDSPNTLTVNVKTDKSNDWTNIYTTSTYIENFTLVEISLSEYVGNSVQLQFECTATSTSYTCIDEIEIIATQKEISQIVWSSDVIKAKVLTFTNNAGGNKWENPANWDGNALPEENDNVIIAAEAHLNSTVKVKNLTLNGGILRLEENALLTVSETLTDKNDTGTGSLYGGSIFASDGAQIIQNNDIKATFKMKINNPSEEDMYNWANPEVMSKTGWQFIASPVKGVGFTVIATSGNQYEMGDKYDLYKYDGTADKEWVNYKGENGNSFGSAFEIGVGYLASHATIKEISLLGFFNSAKKHTYDELTYSDTKELANFHLLGNPFTFDMDMSNAKYTDLIAGVAIVNEEGGYTYGAFTEETTIPVGDGFFVKAIGPNPSLSYDHNNEVEPAARGSEKANSINVIASGKAGEDNVVVNFAGQSEGFNKLQNFNDAIATVYVSENGKNYGIANVDENTTEVALNFDAKEMGSYTISLDVDGEFETVTLVDRFTGVETDMLVENEYSFIASADDNVNRFVIRLGNGQEPTDNGQFVYQNGEELILSIEGSVQIVDMLGRVVYSNEHADAYNRINVAEFNDATYVVRVVNEEGVKVQKVVIY